MRNDPFALKINYNIKKPKNIGKFSINSQYFSGWIYAKYRFVARRMSSRRSLRDSDAVATRPSRSLHDIRSRYILNEYKRDATKNLLEKRGGFIVNP